MLMTRMDITPTIKQTLKNAPTFGFSARYICEKYSGALTTGWEDGIFSVDMLFPLGETGAD